MDNGYQDLQKYYNPMQRKLPSHMIKYYEALWCVADGRIQMWAVDEAIHATVLSSDRTKTYDVSYDQDTNAIMSNDNSSYWKEELWYPALALLLFLDRLDYQWQYGDMLVDIAWKKLNTKNNNDRDLTQDMVDDEISSRGQNVNALHTYCKELMKRVEEMKLQFLWSKQLPAK